MSRCRDLLSYGRLAKASGIIPLLRGASLALAGLAVGSPALSATQWGSYQWASNPSPLTVRKALTGAWGGYVDRAAADWTFASGTTSFAMSMSTIAETGSVKPSTCKGPTGAVEVCNSKYGNNGWLGIAQIWTSGNYILKGSVKLNDSYFTLAQYATTAWKNLVSCQEVGHTLGLSHDDTTFGNPNYGTCMDYTNSPTGGGANGTLDNEYPNDMDYALLECIYTSSSGCGNKSAYLNTKTAAGVPVSSPGSMPTDFGIRRVGDRIPEDVDPGNSPAEWGKAVAFTHDGRGRIYERVIGPGRKIITEVFWVPR